MLGAVALAPPAVMGTVMGGPAALALLAAALAVAAGGAAGASAAGASSAVLPWMSGTAALAGAHRRSLIGFAAGFVAAAAVLRAAGGPGATLAVLQPAIGLPNLLLYAGLAVPSALLWSAVAVAQVAALARAWRPGDGADVLAESAAFALCTVWIMPAASPDLVVVPAVLVLASTVRGSRA
jgi:hypothetical protein